MGELRIKMLQKMELKNFSKKTISVYLHHMEKLVKYYNKSPVNICKDEIEIYLHHLFVEKTSRSGIAQAYSAIKLFYEEVIKLNLDLNKIPRPKIEKKLPVVLSSDEIKRIILSVENLRVQVILMLLYSSGMRLSEGRDLKIQDIDSKRMEIRVEQGKGKKDRYTILSKVLLEKLREYYKIYKPKFWLFSGRHGKPINSSTIQKAFNEAKKKLELQSPLQFTLYATALQLTY